MADFLDENRQPGLVIGFADWLADELGLQFRDVLTCVEEPVPQAELSNSYQRCWNVVGASEATGPVQETPVLVIDDIVGSRWTLTEVGMTLRRAGSGPVHPFALAERRAW